MRLRTKDCYVCNTSDDVLYRCRYQELTDWVFRKRRKRLENRNTAQQI